MLWNSAKSLGLVSLLFSLPALAQFKTPSASSSVEQAAHASAADAKSAPGPTEPAPLPPFHPTSSVQVLTNLKGFNLQPYLETMMPVIKSEWYASIQEVVKNPIYRHGTVVAEFAVERSGEVRDFKITSPSGEEDLDKAVTQALQKASPLPAVPKALVVDDLRFRMNFIYLGKKPPKWWRR